PISVKGRVVDAEDQVVAAVTTQHDGRGAFRFTPKAGATYSLVMDEPAAVASKSAASKSAALKPALPPVMEQSHLVMDAGPGVFQGGSPIYMKLRARQAPSEFA